MIVTNFTSTSGLLQLFADQAVDDMKRYFQGGAVAAYQHVAMLKLHYKIVHALDECLASLEFDEAPTEAPRRRRAQLYKQKSVRAMSAPSGGLHFRKLESVNSQVQASDTTSPSSSISDGYMSDDEHEQGGFDGVECAFGTGRRPSFFTDGKDD